jgi:SNF2 family DNA or RNA helicase
MREIIRWCGSDFVPQVLDGSKDYILPGFKGYVVSMDLLRRLNGRGEKLKELGIKTVIIDEVQHIKNPTAQRSKQVRLLCSEIQHVIGLSGTPIENHAGEYFTILNIVRPDHFPRETTFLWSWCDTYWDGYKQRVGGLRNPQKFLEYTKDFIIRRRRSEVLPELPTVNRNFRFHDLESEVEAAYRSRFREFQLYYYSDTEESSFVRHSNILSHLSALRQLTGLSKVKPCIEFVCDHLEETDRKIIVFAHHHAVADTILKGIKNWCAENDQPEPLQLSADLNAAQRNAVVDAFWSPKHRVLVASTLASGEGLNLQCCSDVIMTERQWNPSKEEQAECRTVRIGQTAEKVNVTYLIAVGTIDEFLTELVERKRQNVDSTLDGYAPAWDESSVVRELAEVLASKGGKKWGW